MNERCEILKVLLLLLVSFPPRISSCLLASDEKREGLSLPGGSSCSYHELLVLGTLGKMIKLVLGYLLLLYQVKCFEFYTKDLHFLLEGVVGDKSKSTQDKVANSRPFDL